MQIFTRLIASGFKVLFNAFGLALVLGAAAGAVTLFVAYQIHPQWPASFLAYVTAGAVGILTGYCTATTVFLRVIMREVVGVTHAAEDAIEGK